MTRAAATLADTTATLARAALLVVALFAPLIAMQSVEASSSPTIIESTYQPASGAGLVLVTSLRRL